MGAPFDMYNFFYFAASEVRQQLADMGYASMSEITGRADLLQPNGKPLHKTENLDLSFTAQMPPAITPEQRAWEPELEEVHAQTNTLDDELLEMGEVIAAIEAHEHKTVETPVVNTDRATGARIAGAVAKAHGNRGWRGSLHIVFTGCAGQSFGAYCLDGLDLEVRGDANDYVGKSLHGGRIRVMPGADTEGRFPLDEGFTPTFTPSVRFPCPTRNPTRTRTPTPTRTPTRTPSPSPTPTLPLTPDPTPGPYPCPCALPRSAPSWATRASTAPPAASSSGTAARASASACATPTRRR